MSGNSDITGTIEIEQTPGAGVDYTLQVADTGCNHNRQADFYFDTDSGGNGGSSSDLNNTFSSSPLSSDSINILDTSADHNGTTIYNKVVVTNAANQTGDIIKNFIIQDLAPTASIAISSPTEGNPTDSTTNIADVNDGSTTEYLIFNPGASVVGNSDNYISHK